MKASTLAPAAESRSTAPTGDREWEGLTRDDLVRAYRTMLLSRRLDDTFEMDIFSPIRVDWLDGTDTYFHKK